VPGTWRQKNQPKSPGGPNGTRILLYSGIPRGYTRRLAPRNPSESKIPCQSGIAQAVPVSSLSRTRSSS